MSKSVIVINVSLKCCVPNVSYLGKETKAQTVFCGALLVLSFPGTHSLTLTLHHRKGKVKYSVAAAPATQHKD